MALKASKLFFGKDKSSYLLGAVAKVGDAASERRTLIERAARPVIEGLESRSYFSLTLGAAFYIDPDGDTESGPPPPPHTGYLGEPWDFTLNSPSGAKADLVIGHVGGTHRELDDAASTQSTVTGNLSSNAGSEMQTRVENVALLNGVGGDAPFIALGVAKISGTFTLPASPDTGIEPDSDDYRAGAVGLSLGLCQACDADSHDPVRYFDGAAKMQFNDFIPTAASGSLDRSWSNNSFSADGQLTQMGNGMSNDGTPYLQDLTSQYQQYTENYDVDGNPRNLRATARSIVAGRLAAFFRTITGTSSAPRR